MSTCCSGPRFQLGWFGERALRIEFAGATTEAASLAVLAAFGRLCEARIAGVVNLTPAYQTLLVTFDPMGLDPPEAEERIAGVLSGVDINPSTTAARAVEIAACYDEPFAPDLAELARLVGLTRSQVIDLHADALYTVAFIGFSPGFPYLFGLPPRLHAPRLATPRARIEPGSIGIAGDQTGIYPQATPGGWRIIGRTPLSLFDAKRAEPALLAPGDRVRFVPISTERFRALIDAREGV